MFLKVSPAPAQKESPGAAVFRLPERAWSLYQDGVAL